MDVEPETLPADRGNIHQQSAATAAKNPHAASTFAVTTSAWTTGDLPTVTRSRPIVPRIIANSNVPYWLGSHAGSHTDGYTEPPVRPCDRPGRYRFPSS